MDVGVPGGERTNVQIGGGDRVTTINLLGCSTSVALATGPTDEEEEATQHIFIVCGLQQIYFYFIQNKF